ncbi:hypothetical protein MSG28_009924 [Choristoneura fumiferana]|uniref:Uncharacterized protein n=1 Tax=Choristoneura fumiferana TaxID=7141 RepID=A0ACC0JD53_CHOFU|nr:hypothetical protein MSG28_009924 [Choristoneura fumiferana]
MSLFPAYGQEGAASEVTELAEPAAAARWAAAPESELLASSDSDAEPAGSGAAAAVAAAAAAPPEADYYEDRRFDGGNLRVSTIYFPGRPQSPSLFIVLRRLPAFPRCILFVDTTARICLVHWECAARRGAPASARGATGRGGGGGGRGGGAGGAGGAEGERAAALRRALAARPADEDLWLQYIDYQEWMSGSGAALAAAEEGAARLPRAGRLAARRLRALQAHAGPHRALAALRDMLAAGNPPAQGSGAARFAVAAAGDAAGARGDAGARGAPLPPPRAICAARREPTRG